MKTNSLFSKKVLKNANMKKSEYEKIKSNSLKLSIFISLFTWLILGFYTKDIFQSGAYAALTMIFIFTLLIYTPVLKQKKHSKKVEASLPLFLSKLALELRVGKDFIKALKNICNGKGAAEKEYQKVIKDFENGSSISNALKQMNQRINCLNIKRANSSLNNIYLHGSSSETLKRLTDDLLLRQKIESKEFSGKMVVYALVFIAISAIVPSMFASFILIGSFFMKISFTPFQVLLVIVVLFPALDISILFMIHSKTPVFLRQ
jgi:archaeal flagellar protein FlaJ